MENKKTFSIRKTFSESWDIVTNQFWKFILVSLILFAASVLAGFVEDQNILFAVGSFLLQIYLGLVWMLIAIRSIEKKKLVFRSVFSEIDVSLYFKFLWLSILVALIVFGGTLLLIIPGIIFAIAYQFSGYFMVDQEIGVRAAMKKSWQGTKGIRWHLFMFVILIGLINLAGLLALGVGILVTIPWTSLALAHVYIHEVKKS